MNASLHHRRWLAGSLAAALLLSAIAPAAYADHGRGKRYKHAKHISRHDEHEYRRADHGGSVYVVRSSSAGPAIAGFLGGLFLGATIAHAAPPAGYYYNDPYCHERFASLEIYRDHLYHYHHPRIVQVVSIRSGDCVRTGRYDDGRWQDADGYGDPRWDPAAYSDEYRDGRGGGCAQR